MKSSRVKEPASPNKNLPVEAIALVPVIKAARRATVASIFKVGDLLKEAKALVPNGQWLRYIREHLEYKEATVRRLIAIASDKRLRQESHATALPICWYTLWELTSLTDEQFNRALSGGDINPNMLRVDVERLKGMWVAGASSVGRQLTHSLVAGTHGPRRSSNRSRLAEQDPVLTTRLAYFEAAVELTADEAERELAACYAHFRRDAEHVEDMED